MVESRSVRRPVVHRCAASWRCTHPAYQPRYQCSGVEKETILCQERAVSWQTAATDRETELNRQPDVAIVDAIYMRIRWLLRTVSAGLTVFGPVRDCDSYEANDTHT